jgi:hypothetical protein
MHALSFFAAENSKGGNVCAARELATPPGTVPKSIGSQITNQ